MKTVLFVHQHFRTPKEGGGVRSYFLAKKLSEAGIDVLVLTGKSASNSDELTLGPNFKVYSLPVFYSQDFGFISRLISFLKFSILAFKFVRSINPKPALAYIISTPLSVGITALLLKRFQKVPFVFEVGDLWPAVPIQMGILKNPFIIWFSNLLEKKCYQEAELISSLSPDISSIIRSEKTKNKIVTIPNFSDNAFFRDVRKPGLVVANEFHVGYSGAAGKANGLEFLKILVNQSQNQEQKVFFHFIMEGSELQEFKQKVDGFPNVKFYPFGSKDQLKQWSLKIDAGFVSFSNFSLLGTGSPNKLFDYLAMGKIVFCNSKGWFEKVVVNNSAGFFIPYSDQDQFFERVRELISSEKMVEKMQKQAIGLAENSFDQESLLVKWQERLSNLEALKD